MTDPIPTSAVATNRPRLDEDSVYAAICDPIRMKMLSALACEGPMTAAELATHIGRSVGAAVKQLVTMRAAGLVVALESDNGDGRRMVYTLSAAVSIITTPTGKAVDLGFCVVDVSDVPRPPAVPAALTKQPCSRFFVISWACVKGRNQSFVIGWACIHHCSRFIATGWACNDPFLGRVSPIFTHS